jgi:hypothetical protein
MTPPPPPEPPKRRRKFPCACSSLDKIVGPLCNGCVFQRVYDRQEYLHQQDRAKDARRVGVLEIRIQKLLARIAELEKKA